MNPVDICVWANGTWCFLEDLNEYLTFMSDDYQSLFEGTKTYNQFIIDNKVYDVTF